MLWEIIKNNLSIIIPIVLPAAFLLLDVFLKAILGQTDFSSLGADACLGGWSLFFGTMLGQIQNSRLSDSNEILTAVIFAGIFLIFWWLCLSMSFKRFPLGIGSPYQPRISIFIGSVVFYYCSVFSFQIMR